MMLPAQNPHQTVTFCPCIVTGIPVWVVVVPYAAILFVNKVIRPEMRLVAKNDFLVNVWTHFKKLRSPLSEQKAYSVAINFELQSQLNLVWVQAQFPNSCSCAPQGINCLMFTCTAMFSADLVFLARMGVASCLPNRPF